MNIIAVDDEQIALIAIERAIKEIDANTNFTSFLYADEAIDYARKNIVDVAFLDIEMSDINGLKLAEQLKKIHEQINIIFVTGFSSYAVDAYQIPASGYVMKPIDSKQIEKELHRLRYPVNQTNQGLYIHCFGNFEVFYDGKPIMFSRPKAKELLAYLVDRQGVSVSKKQLAAILWEDQPYTRSIQTHFHKLIDEIETVMQSVNVKDILIKKNGLYAINTSKFSCDYYDFDKGLPQAINQYHGEYMSEYSWAEFTASFLDKKMK